MKDTMIDSQEFIAPGVFNPSLKNMRFPYRYPTHNHPSTILALKGSRGEKEVQYDF
jgi:hypothetical protein